MEAVWRGWRRTVPVAAVLVLAGCGSSAETSGGTTTPAPAPSVTSPPASELPSPGFGKPLTVRGTVSEGVEHGCLVLTTPQGTYNLLGGSRAGLRPGTTVTVEGTLTDELMTTCQQGLPLRVVRVLPH